MAMDMITALTIKANVVGQSQIGGLERGLGKVSKQSNKAAGAMGRLRKAAGGALGAMRGLLPVIGVGAIAAFAKRSLDAADAMSKLSQRTGIAVPALDKFRQAANLSDTSIQSLERAFPALTKNIDMAAQKGGGPAFEAFQRLGVAVKDANGDVRDADAVMLDIADRFQGMADGTEKAALASAVFGTRIGSELIPMLNMGGDAVRNMNTALTQEMADKAALVNDKITKLGETFGQLGVTLTAALLPVIEAVVGALQGVMSVFNALPGPLQAIVAAVAALAAGLALAIPAIVAISSVWKAFVALKLGATIAGYLPAIAGLIGGLKSFGLVIAGVFTGPVGWAALLVGAGAAIFAFRDQIGEFLGGILQPFKDVFSAIGKAIRAPFEAAANVIRNVFNNVLGVVESVVNAVIDSINQKIQGVNNISRFIGIPAIPTIPRVSIPRFAKGGMVNGAQLAVVGEAGPEYIVPAGKAQGFAQNILAGVRGPAAIPAYAEGGYVGPVNITTGPVMQQGGTNYVTMAQFEAGIRDVASAVTRQGRSYGARRFTGIS